MNEEYRPLIDNASAREYDSIAEQYETSFEKISYRTYVEQFSVMNAVGDVTGLRVLDVACGTGFYSRLLRQRGASQVVGVDIASEMVQYAQSLEAATPLGVTYLARDVAAMEVLGTFDLVIGVYLLHYATSSEHLEQMCQRIANNLVDGGRLVTATLNPSLSRQPDYYIPYEIAVYAHDDMDDGTPYSFAFRIAQGMTPPMTIHYWSKAKLERVLELAGFTDIRCQEALVSPEGITHLGREFWAQHEAAPLCVLLTATKQSGA